MEHFQDRQAETFSIDDDGIKIIKDEAESIRTNLLTAHMRARTYDEESNLLLDSLLADIDDALLADSEDTHVRLERDQAFALIDYFQAQGISQTVTNQNPNNEYMRYVEQLSDMLNSDISG